MNPDPNCLSTWLPILQQAGLPVPRTSVLDTGRKWQDMRAVLDGEKVPLLDNLCARIDLEAVQLGGYPVFLRTGQGAGKHQWRETCHVPEAGAIPGHVARLIEWSETVDFLGLPYRFWAVRELLPVAPVAILPRYGSMPLVKEVRCFVEGGRVKCHHPYWPPRAIAEGLEDVQLFRLSEILTGMKLTESEWEAALHLAAQAAGVLAGSGSWSVDLLATRQGWYVTDVAEAARSFHWPGCTAH